MGILGGSHIFYFGGKHGQLAFGRTDADADRLASARVRAPVQTDAAKESRLQESGSPPALFQRAVQNGRFVCEPSVLSHCKRDVRGIRLISENVGCSFSS